MSNALPEMNYRRAISRTRQFERIALLVGFSNIILAVLIVALVNYQTIWSGLNFFKPANQSIVVEKSDLLATSRLKRVGNDIFKSLASLPPKSGSTITRDYLAGDTVADYAAPGPGSNYPVNAVTSGPETPDSETYVLEQENQNIDSAVSADSAAIRPGAGQKVAPILLKDNATGKLQIGNFKALSIEGSVDECLEVGESMLGDVGLSKNLLNILTASKQITIAKICANNGVIVISCRSQQITVSPRHFQMHDKCKSIG